MLAPASRQYLAIEESLKGYDHPLLRRLAFVGSYEGGAVPAGQRSFTFRATLGDASRTLLESDIQQFRQEFIAFLGKLGLTLRT